MLSRDSRALSDHLRRRGQAVWLPPPHGGRMGIPLPGRDRDGLVLWRIPGPPFLLRLDLAELGESRPAPGLAPSERFRNLRRHGKRLGVVPGWPGWCVSGRPQAPLPGRHPGTPRHRPGPVRNGWPRQPRRADLAHAPRRIVPIRPGNVPRGTPGLGRIRRSIIEFRLPHRPDALSGRNSGQSPGSRPYAVGSQGKARRSPASPVFTANCRLDTPPPAPTQFRPRSIRAQ